MDNNLVDEICQACLAENGPMKDMLTEILNDRTLIECFRLCTGVELRRSNENNKNIICLKCEQDLKLCVDFRERCITSQQILHERSSFIAAIKDEPISDEDYAAMMVESKDQSFTQVYVKNSSKVKVEPIKDEVTVKPETNGSGERQKKSLKKRTEKPTMETIDTSNYEASYMCYHCDAYLPTHSEYVTHRDNHVRGNTDLVEERKIARKCFVCHKDVVGYVKHLEEEHKDFKPHSCKTCDSSFHNQMQLKKHLSIHTDLQVECLGCRSFFKNTTFLRNHIAKEKHSPDLYHCPHCGLGCIEFKHLNNHFTKEHSSQYSKQLYPCFTCKKVFSFNKHVLKHECRKAKKRTEAPTSSGQYKCCGCQLEFSCDDELVCHTFSLCEARFACSVPGCGKVFTHRRGISDHVREAHERQSSFVCDQCGFCTHAPRKLLLHKAKHNPVPADPTLFKCPHEGCTAVLKSKCSLLTHKSIHQERRFECALCQKKFRFFPTLRDHMATHTNTNELRPFGCDFCSQRFIRARDKRRHLKIHTGERPNICSLCAASFRDVGTLNQHFRRVHTSLCYKCKFCEKTYKDKAKLREHLFVHRGFKPFNCPACPQQFVKKYLFVKHLLTHDVVFDESVHGYREMENLDHVFENCARLPTDPLQATPILYQPTEIAGNNEMLQRNVSRF